MLKEPTAYQHELDLTDKVPDASTISQNRRRRFADTHVTPANVHDSQPYLARLDRQSERFNLNPYAVGLDAAGKKIHARRKETVERSFADAKQLHVHRYPRLLGLKKVMEQCLLAATAQNMKKIALLLAQLLTSFYALTTPRMDRLCAQIKVLHGFLTISSNQHMPA